MSNKKETPVSWLVEQLVKMDKQLDGRRKNEDATVMKMNPSKILKQANEMFERQIIEAYIQGFSECDNAGICACEKYYKETYNNI